MGNHVSGSGSESCQLASSGEKKNRVMCCQVGTAEYAFLPCGYLDFESAVTAKIDEFKAVLIARIHAC